MKTYTKVLFPSPSIPIDSKPLWELVFRTLSRNYKKVFFIWKGRGEVFYSTDLEIENFLGINIYANDT